MLRRSRFKPQILSPELQLQTATAASQRLHNWAQQYHQGQLSAAELCSLFLIFLLAKKRPLDFLGGKQQETWICAHGRKAAEFFHELELAPKFQSRWQGTLMSLIGQHSLRSLPWSVNRSLCQWHLGQYPLQLLFHIPSTDEVHQLQTQGQRCVSLLMQESELTQAYTGGRDSLGFLVHDLIHADHFFLEPQKRLAQVQFSKYLWQLKEHAWIQQRRGEDPQFDHDWDYLVSDMNTVPLHLLKALKAISLMSFKRQHGLLIEHHLTPHLQSHFDSLWETFVQPIPLSLEEKSAAVRLNTALYQHPQDSLLLDQALHRI